MESLVHRISLEYRWTNPFQDKRKVANHEDEKSSVSFTDLEVDLQRPIEIQGNLGESPFKRLYYQTCGWCSCLCHSDFNLGPSSCHYVAMKIFFAALGLRWLRPLLLNRKIGKYLSWVLIRYLGTSRAGKYLLLGTYLGTYLLLT